MTPRRKVRVLMNEFPRLTTFFFGPAQAVCGMSVVDGDWDELKRYNLTELYAQGQKARLTRGDSKKEEDA